MGCAVAGVKDIGYREHCQRVKWLFIATALVKAKWY
jgi:hypothetical protein